VDVRALYTYLVKLNLRRLLVFVLGVLPSLALSADLSGYWESRLEEEFGGSLRVWTDGIHIVQHGSVACGVWWGSPSPNGRTGGYISGTVTGQTFRAYKCGDGDPYRYPDISKFQCPRFDPKPHIYELKGSQLITETGCMVSPECELDRIQRDKPPEGNGKAKDMVLACVKGSNIPLQGTGEKPPAPDRRR
jgi:hypothetical protein